MLALADLHWLAGLLEGEGCFTLRAQKWRRATPSIALRMTDGDVVRRAERLMSQDYRTPGKGRRYVGVSCYPGARPGYKAVYAFRLYGARAAGWMMTLWPLMGDRRRARIADVLRQCGYMPSYVEDQWLAS